jgi:hypothetical protein
MVKLEAAARQVAAGQQERDGGTTGGQPSPLPSPPPPQTAPRRFYATVELDPVRLGAQAAQIADEVTRHLTALLGAQVKVTPDIQTCVEGGIPDSGVRTVGETADAEVQPAGL